MTTSAEIAAKAKAAFANFNLSQCSKAELEKRNVSPTTDPAEMQQSVETWDVHHV